MNWLNHLLIAGWFIEIHSLFILFSFCKKKIFLWHWFISTDVYQAICYTFIWICLMSQTPHQNLIEVKLILFNTFFCYLRFTFSVWRLTIFDFTCRLNWRKRNCVNKLVNKETNIFLLNHSKKTLLLYELRFDRNDIFVVVVVVISLIFCFVYLSYLFRNLMRKKQH